MKNTHITEGRGLMISYEAVIFMGLFFLDGYGLRAHYGHIGAIAAVAIWPLVSVGAYILFARWIVYRESRGLFNPATGGHPDYEAGVGWAIGMGSVVLAVAALIAFTLGFILFHAAQ